MALPSKTNSHINVNKIKIAENHDDITSNVESQLVYKPFLSETKACIYGFNAKATQNMLDFD